MKERYTVTTDGFCGRWFEGTTHKDKVVIVMPGTGTAIPSGTKSCRATRYRYLWNMLKKPSPS